MKLLILLCALEMERKKIIILPFLLSVGWQMLGRERVRCRASYLTPPSPKLSQTLEIIPAHIQNRGQLQAFRESN